MAWLASKQVSPTLAKENIKTNKLSGDAFMGKAHMIHMLTEGGAQGAIPRETIQRFLCERSAASQDGSAIQSKLQLKLQTKLSSIC